VGPNVLTREELLSPFEGAGGFEVLWAAESRFDATAHYRDQLGKRPLAWWALLRRRPQ
jgi:hypothetical protein